MCVLFHGHSWLVRPAKPETMTPPEHVVSQLISIHVHMVIRRLCYNDFCIFIISYVFSIQCHYISKDLGRFYVLKCPT